MKKNLTGMGLSAALLLSLTGAAHGQDSSGVKVIERQVRIVMGSRETQEECREFARVVKQP